MRDKSIRQDPRFPEENNHKEREHRASLSLRVLLLHELHKPNILPQRGRTQQRERVLRRNVGLKIALAAWACTTSTSPPQSLKDTGDSTPHLPPTQMVEQGKKVKCSSTEINEVLWCTMKVIHYLVNQIQKKTLYDLKGWLARFISDLTRSCIGPRVQIEKKELNEDAQYWFGFISRNLIPSQNESIL
uniref:Putative plant transposon protein domain-containing protein n=1 Tax=Solanum tuberosum TaxID=4113 RepID=M1DDI8_SOLTU